jgi:hypothetical protein
VKLKCPRAPKGVSKKELAQGLEVELEHTNDRRAAACIRNVHLHECKSYYARLDKLEKACKR